MSQFPICLKSHYATPKFESTQLLNLHSVARVWRYGGQARQEPQRGPGKHYRGALSPHCVCLEIETPKGAETWGEVSPHHPTRGSGERKLAAAENGFYAYFRSKRSHLEHNFQYFLSDGGVPQTSRGQGKLSPFPLSTGLMVGTGGLSLEAQTICG